MKKMTLKNLRVIFLILILSYIFVYYIKKLCSKESYLLSEDGRLSFLGLAMKYGHSAVGYNITTEDGYILTLYRQPGDTRKPVLLIHGNTPTSDCWILRGNSSMVITLAKQGYDVWSINLRGTEYSRSHVFLDPDRDGAKFFNYTFYELGIYDLPATIDFILNETGQDKLSVIAHSVGTTIVNVMGSERPDYNEKISVAIFLSPIVFLHHVRGYAGLLLPIIPAITNILSIFNTHEVFTNDGAGAVLRLLCLVFSKRLCVEIIVFPLLGYDRKGFEPEFLTSFLGHFPGGSSRKMYEHLSQVSRRNKFAKYDYGVSKNIQEYGTSEAPEFHLERVTMRTALFVGQEDYLGTVKDGERLNRSLPNVVHYQVLPYKKFNHADFVWGSHMSDYLYPYVIGILKSIHKTVSY